MLSATYGPIPKGRKVVEGVEKWVVGLLATLWGGCAALGAYIWRRQTQDIAEIRAKLEMKANKDSTDKRFDEILDLMKTHADTTNVLSANISDMRADLAYVRGRFEAEGK